jgi:hypothetical protein
MKRMMKNVVVLLFAVIVGLVLGSKLTATAENPKMGGGAFEVVATSSEGDVAFGTLFTPDGSVVASVAPLACSNSGLSIGMVFGSWAGKLAKHGVDLRFHVVGPVYQNGQLIGQLQGDGFIPNPFGAVLEGRMQLQVPEQSGCGSLNGEELAFTARPIPPTISRE